MPFDSTKFTPQLRRATLIRALRNYKTEVPKFNWDFRVVRTDSECGTCGCAMGLASILWPEIIRETGNYYSVTQFFIDTDKIAKLFGMTSDQVNNIFFDPSVTFYGAENPTPSMVADALEALDGE